MRKTRLYILLLITLWIHFSSVFGQTTYKSEKDLKKNADILFKKENYIAALPLFSQLLSLYPKEADYSYKFGVCLLMADKRDIEKPIKYLETAAEDPNVEKQVFYFLGLAYHYNYRFKEAINYYNRFLQSAPKNLHKKYDAARQIEMCYNGIALLSSISDLYVLEKHNVGFRNFYRSYNVKDFGGRFLMLPPELKTKVDVKNEHNPIIFFSENSEYLYYSSYGQKDETGKDIYRVFRNTDGSWGDPERLPNIINTDYDEDYPFILSDGLTLFFSSKGHNSMGGYDVFSSYLDTTTNTWSNPINLDFAINTPFDDILFITNDDISSAYFASNRVSDIGMINVYKVHLELNIARETLALGDVFNLSKDDPAYKRSLELLKNKTQLEVNATDAMFEKQIAVVSPTDKQPLSKDNDKEKETQVPSLSDQDIIKLAYQQADELKTELNELKQKMNASKIVAEQRKQKTLVRLNEANKARNDAQRIANPKQREDALIEASKIQAEADRLQKESEVAEIIYKDIEQMVKLKEKEAKDADTYADNIKKAIESDSPEKALEILNQMNAELITEDASVYTDKTIEEIIAEADKMIPDEKNEIQELFSEINRLNNEADKLRKEAALNKNKNIKEDLIVQAENYENEARQLKAELDKMTEVYADDNTEKIKDENLIVEKDNKITVSMQEIKKVFDANSQKIINQQSYLLSQAIQKANQSNDEYNKAQKLISEAELSNDKKTKEKKLNEAQALLDNAAKNTMEALALIAVADSYKGIIEKNEKDKEQLSKDIINIENLIEKNETSKAEKLVESLKEKYKIKDEVVIIDDKSKTELINKIEKNESDAQKLANTASNNYNKINDNNIDIVNLKNDLLNYTDKKEIEKINNRIEQLEKENLKLKNEADEAFKKSSEMKFEAGKLRMQVAIITSVIPSDVQVDTDKTAALLNNDVILMQSNVINESTKIIENEQKLKVDDYIAKNESKKQEDSEKVLTAEKEAIREKTSDIREKYNSVIEVYEDKAEKLYNYAQQKTDLSKQGIEQADKILQNAQNIKDTNIKKNEIEKADKLYKKSFEQAQEAMAAVSLAKDYENTAFQMKKDRENLNNQLTQSLKFSEAGNTKAAEDVLNKIQSDYILDASDKNLENIIANSANSVINIKEKEALELLELSKKQYDDVQKLKTESDNLLIQAGNEKDSSKRNELVDKANVLKEQAVTTKQLADDNLNKGEKIKIEVGVLKMKVSFTLSVNDMPEPNNNLDAQKQNILTDVNKLEQKIDTHNFSELNKEAVVIAEKTKETLSPVKVEDNEIPKPYVPKTDNINELEKEKQKNTELALEEKRKAQLTQDLNERLNIEAKAAQYDENTKIIQVHIYDVNSNKNKEEIEKNKTIINNVKIQNDSDENARKAKQIENESVIYTQRAESRRKEAEKTDDKALKVNLMEDALRNEELAINKQKEAIEFYKKASYPLVAKDTASYTQKIPDNKKDKPPVVTTEKPPVVTTEKPVIVNPNSALSNDDGIITNIKGLFFTVQIGVFGATRTASQLFNLLPIFYDRMTNGYYRYFSGIYSSRETAVSAKNNIVLRGIPDAFVVAYYNGKRITVAEATDMLQRGTAQLQNQLAFTNVDTSVPITKTENKITQGSVTGFYYTVQIGVYKDKREANRLFNISPIEYETLPNGLQRHLSGRFNNRQEADKVKNDIVRKGVDDAFVVAYLNGKRISLADARKYESGDAMAITKTADNVINPVINTTVPDTAKKQTPTTTTVKTETDAITYNAEDIFFKVQVGAFAKPVSTLIISQYRNASGENIETLTNEQGLTIYLVGNYNDFLSASAMRNKIVNNGVSDAFVVAYHKNKRIPLNVARELKK